MEETGGEIRRGAHLADLLRRPGVDYETIRPLDPERPELPHEVAEEAEIAIKYEGYIKREREKVEKIKRLSSRLLPEGIDYLALKTLRTEARQKLSAAHPKTVGEAMRISGVSPADISALLLYTEEAEDKEDDGSLAE